MRSPDDARGDCFTITPNDILGKKMKQDDRYTLATGELGAHRLSLLNTIHKPYTEFLLQRVGLEAGMVVADIGCAVQGMFLTGWLNKLAIVAGSLV